jgi:hypothetical protein
MYNSSWTIHYTFNGRQGELRMYYNVPTYKKKPYMSYKSEIEIQSDEDAVGKCVDMTDEYYLKDLYHKAKIEIARRHHTTHLDKIVITQADWDEDLGYEDLKNWLHTKYIKDTYPHWPRQYDEEYGVYV